MGKRLISRVIKVEDYKMEQIITKKYEALSSDMLKAQLERLGWKYVIDDHLTKISRP